MIVEGNWCWEYNQRWRWV